MTSLEVKTLKDGDIIQHKETGESYIVIYTGMMPLVMRTLMVTNPVEWDKVAKK